MTAVRNVITYTATVWWLILKLKNSITELSKWQRLANFGIIGAMRTAPTTAILFNL
jgi:hypothetical protein